MRGGRKSSTIRIALAIILLAGSARAASQEIPLDGVWREWTDTTSYVDISVPFSRPPKNALIAYERLFSIPTGACNDMALLRFDHAVGSINVYLNGQYLGTGTSFLPFHFDVSGLLSATQPNDLVVTIDDRRDGHTVPYDENSWTEYSGISGPVHLECNATAAIIDRKLQYDLTQNFAHVAGELDVHAAAKPGTLLTFNAAILQGDSGNWSPVALFDTHSDVPAGSDGVASATMSFAFDDPILWSPDTPYLYKLYLTVSDTNGVVDDALEEVGFRDIHVAGPDVLLNGEPIFLKGLSRHDIYPDTGFVGTEAQMVDDMQRIKQAGVNYVRLIHYPHHPRILELADELGLLVSEEVPAWANFWDPQVRDQLYDMLEAMIRRDSLHPSIFLWITGNARAHPLPYAQDAQTLIHSLDRNRLGTFVIDNDEYDEEVIAADVAFFHEAGLDLYMKITWWFYYIEYLQDAWENFPKDIPLVIAEFGREGDDREPIVVNDDGEFFWGEDQQNQAVSEMLEAWRPHLPPYDAKEHIAGMVLFNYQDYQWDDVPLYLPGHIPSMHTGLVYEDRVGKRVYKTLANFYTKLPTDFVGLPQADDDAVERLFVNPIGLGSSVNGPYRDSAPCSAANGSVIFLASDGPDYVGLPKLYSCTNTSGVWSEPMLLDMPQDTASLAFRGAPCVTRDGHAMYFTRAVLNGIYVAESRIWESQWNNGQWSQPIDLGEPLNVADPAKTTSDPAISTDGMTMLFSSDRSGGQGGLDLWMSRKEAGGWSTPVNLGPVINSPYADREPALSFDGRTLYFSSDRPGGMGSSDIWVSHLQTPNGQSAVWSTPKNLGPELNSPGAERDPDVSEDGMKLFFTGIRNGGEGLSDIWMANALCEAGGVSLHGPDALIGFSKLQSCMTSPRQRHTVLCAGSDMDGDEDVDLGDYARVQRCFDPPR